jgi:predicted ester cyclase
VLSDFHKVFLDVEFTIEDIISEGDEVAVRSRATLTSASGAKSITQIAIYRMSDGKIVESWSHSDSFF